MKKKQFLLHTYFFQIFSSLTLECLKAFLSTSTSFELSLSMSFSYRLGSQSGDWGLDWLYAAFRRY